MKVYVSVFGDDRGKEVAIAGLKSKAKYVRSELGRRMKLRLTPEIRFIEDESFERGSRVRELIITCAVLISLVVLLILKLCEVFIELLLSVVCLINLYFHFVSGNRHIRQDKS